MQAILSYINRYKKHLYFIGLAIMAIALPVSEFLMSISMFALAVAWLLNGPKKMQWQAFKNNKLAWITSLIFLIDLAGLVNTTDYQYALSDLRIKLPLLLVPVFIASARFSKKEFTTILFLFVGSTIVGTIICFTNYQINLKDNLADIREISIFISHIRFGLMINLAIFILIYYAIKLNNKWTIVLILMAGWLIYFLVFLGSVNGYLVFTLLLILGIFILIFKSSKPKTGIVLGLILFLFTGYLGVISYGSYKSYFVPRQDAYNDPAQLSKRTVNGNRLENYPNNLQLQNGYYVWRHISRKELRKEWKKRADSLYYQYDIKQQLIYGTVIKYLTSKGLTKDSVGMEALSDQDIRNIEMGYTDYRIENWNNLKLRVDQFFFQLNALSKDKNPGGKSFVQRILSLKASLNIIKNNFFTGVGTGDIKDAFNRYYQVSDSKLQAQYRVRTHNQYLTYFVAHGIFGFLLFLFATSYPLFRFNKSNLILAIGQIILLFSFLSEDTLETQPGVTLYIFIIALGIVLLKDQLKPADPLPGAEA